MLEDCNLDNYRFKRTEWPLETFVCIYVLLPPPLGKEGPWPLGLIKNPTIYNFSNNLKIHGILGLEGACILPTMLLYYVISQIPSLGGGWEIILQRSLEEEKGPLAGFSFLD